MMLKQGTVVHVYGLPVKLISDVLVETHPDNWPLIEAEHAKATDGTHHARRRSDGSFGYPADLRLTQGPSGGLPAVERKRAEDPQADTHSPEHAARADRRRAMIEHYDSQFVQPPGSPRR